MFSFLNEIFAGANTRRVKMGMTVTFDAYSVVNKGTDGAKYRIYCI
ncbi:MAG: hypothetical protein WBN72_00970 [Nitrososphaeraceae archaeon]